MQYKESVKHLYSRQQFGIKLGMENMQRIMKLLGDPQNKFKSIHIAGTNGKGSTSAILASILSQTQSTRNGTPATQTPLRIGLYTSPHITKVEERFVINGEMISRKDFLRIYTQVRKHLDEVPCTFFECTTAIALLYFAEKNVDYAIIETGLGGRFDASNIVTPVCSVITNIDYDHIEYLGDTLESIAFEKAGIIKQNVPVVINVKQPECIRVIEKQAEKLSSKVIQASKEIEIRNIKRNTEGFKFEAVALERVVKSRRNGIDCLNITLPFHGKHQIDNLVTALSVIANLKIAVTDTDIKEGVLNTKWAERFQFYKKEPNIIIDVAHNEAGFREIAEDIKELFPGKKIRLVIGLKSDKNYHDALLPIVQLCKFVYGIPVTAMEGIRNSELKSFFQSHNVDFEGFRSVNAGIKKAVADSVNDDIILCAGSHYTVKSIKRTLNA